MPVSKTEQWIDWALQKAESLPVIGDRVADYRQERVWNNPEAVKDRGEQFDRDYAAAMLENEAFDQENEPDWRALLEAQHRSRDTHSDAAIDYAEAYADVAGDPTLAWRLAEESPIDILADVQQTAHEDADIWQSDPPTLFNSTEEYNRERQAIRDHDNTVRSNHLESLTEWNPFTGTFQSVSEQAAIEAPAAAEETRIEKAPVQAIELGREDDGGLEL